MEGHWGLWGFGFGGVQGVDGENQACTTWPLKLVTIVSPGGRGDEWLVIAERSLFLFLGSLYRDGYRDYKITSRF